MNGRALTRMSLVLAGAAIVGCGGTGTETYTKTVNTFDAFGSPVAKFRFTQSDRDVSLVIESTSPRIVSMTYNVDFLLNLAAWQY